MLAAGAPRVAQAVRQAGLQAAEHGPVRLALQAWAQWVAPVAQVPVVALPPLAPA